MAVYGAGAGYDVRSGNVVVGLLGEVSGTTNGNCGDFDIKATQQASSLAGRLCTGHQRSLFAGARLGYVLGGYENVRARTSLSGTVDGKPAPERTRVSEDGFRVGGGVEHALSDHAFVKAEYRYSRTGPQDPSSERHQLVTGVGFRF